MSEPTLQATHELLRHNFEMARRDMHRLKELLAEHQELGRLQGNRMDLLTEEMGVTQARLRAAQVMLTSAETQLAALRGAWDQRHAATPLHADATLVAGEVARRVESVTCHGGAS